MAMSVGDEVWVALALLHREQPERRAFRVAEILARARAEYGTDALRPGFQTYVSRHAVANLPPNPARHRLLYATDHGERRLFRSGDSFHDLRDGKTVPAREALPERYRTLVDWYHATYDRPVPTTLVREAAATFDAGAVLPASQFETQARHALSERFGVPLISAAVPGVPKQFDFVAPDGSLIGDAKFFGLVNGKSLPPAKFSIIAEHVWLLEKTGAQTKVLVFGNDRRVPEEWLRRYGHLASDVHFYFLGSDGELRELPEPGRDEGSWNPLSSGSFARDWNSEEDSVYDTLPPG